MILWIAIAASKPTTVVTFDNGGFNLPLYTGRWNGQFAQPSVAQQLAGDIARLQGESPRVFTYLPPGRGAGRSSDPYEVLPRSNECARPDTAYAATDPCFCAAGDRCWHDLDANRHPAASTSLYQAATAMRERVGSGPRIEVHFTDLFEEDPNSANNLADADRCVSPASTRKAIEALMRPTKGSMDHVAVGLLTASIAPPRSASGGAVQFVEKEGGCWSARRLRTFGGGGAPLELAMGVVVLGIDTEADDAWVRRFIEDLGRQVSDPLALNLVVVREPRVNLRLPSLALGADAPMVQLPSLPPRSTPCAALTATTALMSAGDPLGAQVASTCSSAGFLTLSHPELQRAFHRQAGLNPLRTGVGVAGSIDLVGDGEAVRKAVAELPEKHPVSDRPLPFWGAMSEALRLGESDGVWRPRAYRVEVEDLEIGGLDDRPWVIAAMFAVLLALFSTAFLYLSFGRLAANRAFRRHLGGAARGRPVAAVLAEASEEARAGWLWRLLVALMVASAIGATAGLLVLLAYGARVG